MSKPEREKTVVDCNRGPVLIGQDVPMKVYEYQKYRGINLILGRTKGITERFYDKKYFILNFEGKNHGASIEWKETHRKYMIQKPNANWNIVYKAPKIAGTYKVTAVGSHTKKLGMCSVTVMTKSQLAKYKAKRQRK